MYDKIASMLPDKYVDRQNIEWKFVGASKFLMYSMIKEDQLFGLHTDIGSVFNVGENRYSKFTVLIYLNDEFEGGRTTFYDNNFKQTVSITPKPNKTLVFDIDLYHCGEMVSKGNKFWIGTELVCQKICS